MAFEVAPEERELVESVSSVLASECPTALVRDVVENGSAPEQPWKSARELGWTAIDLPEALGVDALDVGFEGPRFDDGFGSPPWMTQYLHSYRGTIAAGTSEIQRNIIAQRVLGLPRR